MSSTSQCPRCGGRGLEHLKTHSYCSGCNYYEVKNDFSYENLMLALKGEFEEFENMLKHGIKMLPKESVA